MSAFRDQEQISSGRLLAAGYAVEWTVAARTGRRVPR
jgi:hypothetical protein